VVFEVSCDALPQDFEENFEEEKEGECSVEQFQALLRNKGFRVPVKAEEKHIEPDDQHYEHFKGQ